MSPQAAEALRAGVLEIDKSDAILLRFEQKGMSLLEAGKVREALVEFRDLSKNHPKEALHHSQIARALLAAGLGEAARTEARRAVEMEPKSASAHATLAFVLQHDLLGRFRHKGFDYAGAESAYRKAIELDEEDVEARADLAILLEHNAQGVRYGKDAKLPDAIALYQAISKNVEDTPLAGNLPIALTWARRFAEAKVAAKRLPVSSGNRTVVLLTATAATDGAAAAIREASLLGLDPESRRQGLESAGDLLLKLRLYPQAGALLSAAAQGSANASALLARGNMIANLKRHEESSPPPDDPQSVVPKVLAVFFADEATAQAEIAKITSKHGKHNLNDPDEIEKTNKTMRSARSGFLRSGLPQDVMLDLMLGVMRFNVEGDKATGFRIQAQNPGGAKNLTLLITWEDGSYRVLDSGETADIAGREIWDKAEAGNLEGARRLLDWIRETQTAGGGEDPIAGPLLPRFWTRGNAGDKDAILLGAAAILAGDKDDDRAMPLLKSSLERASSDKARADLLMALTVGYTARRRPAEAEVFAGQLARMNPSSAAAFQGYASALLSQMRWKQARVIAEERLTRLPDDADALRILDRCAFVEGNYDEALRHLRKLIAMGKAKPADWNSIGWQALFHPPVSEQMAQEVQAGISQTPTFDVLHTMAMLYAELGKTTEARDVLWQAMEVEGIDEPNSSVWLAVGRIAENFDATAAAQAAYAKVERPKQESEIIGSSYTLAQRRLAALGKAH